MKKLILIALLFSFPLAGIAQNVYSKKGYAVAGYDLTTYFDNAPKKGIEAHQHTYKGQVFLFTNHKNLEAFKISPEQYLPQYDGYCAYGVGKKSAKFSINPETYEIRDGKLYLFYNAWGNNTLDLWLEENPEELRSKADENWKSIQH